MFQNLGNLTSLLRQAQQAGSQMEEIQQRLKSERVTGAAGAGMIEIEANGLGEVLKVKIDPALIEKGEAEMITHRNRSPLGYLLLACAAPRNECQTEPLLRANRPHTT